MGNCVYCGEKAGFLRSKHKECWSKHSEGFRTIKSTVRDAFLHNKVENIKEAIDDVAKDSFINDQEKKRSVMKGWEDAIDVAFDDGILTEEEEKSLLAIVNCLGFSHDELNDDSAYEKLVKGSILRSVMNGEIPNKVGVEGQLPFNFQKGEQLIWLEHDVKYYETKVKTRYVGGSSGVSIRIAKGIYYRTGSFKGERVQNHETNHVDTGSLAITNKHIYFGGDFKSFRVPFSKIVSFMPYSDGFGMQKDAATAKPQIFLTGDGWFIYNLVANISNIS